MKNINEIDPLEYDFFHLAKLNGDVTVFAKTTGGMIEVPDVDYYQTDNGVLLCFKEKSYTHGYHDYQIVGDNGDYIMQMLSYENLQDVFQGTTEYPFSFYNFWNSIEMPSSGTPPTAWGGTGSLKDGKEFVRCDYNKFGPVPFYPRTTRYEVVSIKLVLSATGVGHILRVDTKDQDFKDKSTQIVNTYSRTFSGILKQIFEWSEVSKPPFSSTENPAVQAAAFIDALGINDVMNEINSSENNMRVSRYIQGNNEIYQEIEEKNIFPESLKNYFLSHIRYKTLNSLLKNSNDSFTIDNSILYKEKSSLEASVYTFCIMNNIDPNTNSMDDIELLARNNKLLTNFSENIVEKIIKYRFI